MRRATQRIFVAALLAGAVAAALTSCTSSGDGGLGVGGGIQRGVTSFAAGTTPTPSNHYAWMSQQSGGLSSLCVNVNVQNVIDLYSIAFTLEYDPAVLDFTSATPGSFLGTTTQTLFQAQETPSPPSTPNAVVVGLTRRSDVVTTGVNGSGRIATLCFSLVAPSNGSSALTFTGNRQGETFSGAIIIPPATGTTETHFVDASFVVE